MLIFALIERSDKMLSMVYLMAQKKAKKGKVTVRVHIHFDASDRVHDICIFFYFVQSFTLGQDLIYNLVEVILPTFFLAWIYFKTF